MPDGRPKRRTWPLIGGRGVLARSELKNAEVRPAMQNDDISDLLKDEYLKLQDMYENYDQRSLMIKGWVDAGSIAGIAVALDSDSARSPLIWIVISVFSLCIWFLEAKWKTFQYALRDRIRMIEGHFRNDKDLLIKEIHPFQIYYWWFKSYRHDEPIYPYEEAGEKRPKSYTTRLVISAFQTFVMLPYVLILIFSVVGLVLSLEP